MPNNIDFHYCEGPNSLVRIEVVDDPTKEGVNSKYQCYTKQHGNWQKSGGEIKLQKGPVTEPGLNGITNEALLCIVLHRLQAQNKACGSRETSLALTKLEEAMMWLHAREKDRMKRGVKDSYEK